MKTGIKKESTSAVTRNEGVEPVNDTIGFLYGYFFEFKKRDGGRLL